MGQHKSTTNPTKFLERELQKKTEKKASKVEKSGNEQIVV
jgi:hypothetical protein